MIGATLVAELRVGGVKHSIRKARSSKDVGNVVACTAGNGVVVAGRTSAGVRARGAAEEENETTAEDEDLAAALKLSLGVEGAAAESEAESEETAAQRSLLVVGSNVELVGVKTRPELNGRIAEVLSYDDESKRYSIRISRMGSSGMFKLKREHLKPTELSGWYHKLDMVDIKTADTLGRVADVSSMLEIAKAKQPANKDVKYWGSNDHPWRNGTNDSIITDPDVIAAEEVLKAEAEKQDADASPEANAHAAVLHSKGIRIDFLLFLTEELDLWEWKTWEVVQYLVKPATEGEGRCRFADLTAVKAHTGGAGVFMRTAGVDGGVTSWQRRAQAPT